MGKVIYTNDDGARLKRLVIYFTVKETQTTLETFITVPENMTDEEIMNLARTFRNAETECGFYDPDEEE